MKLTMRQVSLLLERITVRSENKSIREAGAIRIAHSKSRLKFIKLKREFEEISKEHEDLILKATKEAAKRKVKERLNIKD